MSKSSSIGGLRGKPTGTVTVIDSRFHRSSARNAKVAFYVTAFVVGLLTATVAADRLHPILALLAGALVGVTAGAVVWALVRVWPLIRLIWWWLPEILLALAVVYGWTVLARNTDSWLRLIVVTLVVGLPAAIPWTRRRITAWVWCLIVRHRLRTCFAQFITANRSGSLPLILIARPTPVGERVWIYLRAGLSLAELEARLDKIAVACHAASVVVDKASARNAAFVRVDVKRREVLDATVASPLVDLVDRDDIPAPATTTPGDPPPTALDLPDVATIAAAPTLPATGRAGNGNGNGRRPATTPASTTSGDDADDVTQWI